MKFYEYGDHSRPLIIMLTGSFCPAKALSYLYEPLSADYHIIIPDYNGHYQGSKPFTTRKNEAREIVRHLKKRNLRTVALLYGQSMGSEIGIELMHQLLHNQINVQHAVFDGAPCIRLSVPYKAFMYFKFRSMINLMRKKTADEVLRWKFLNQFTNGDTESLRPMLESLISVAPYLTNETIRNENECCYTFDFPKFSERVQSRIHFLYGESEKAYKTCHTLVRKAYPHARMTVFKGYAHMTYSAKNTENYINMLKKEIRRQGQP